jgi:hypothetical protein
MNTEVKKLDSNSVSTYYRKNEEHWGCVTEKSLNSRSDTGLRSALTIEIMKYEYTKNDLSMTRPDIEVQRRPLYR